MLDKKLILTHEQIEKKINRIALQVFEKVYDKSSIVLAGINTSGNHIAILIKEQLSKISDIKITLINIDINAIDQNEITQKIKNSQNCPIILIDDVLNTGETMLKSVIPFFNLNFKEILVVVLADRNHRTYPIIADMVGISLATTLQEHITFYIDAHKKMSLYLS